MRLRRLTPKSIRPYGRIIDASCVTYKPGDNGFGILFKERSAGWRVAYLVVRRRRIERLERHPNTAETFEPVTGKTAIALAPKTDPEDVRLFLLDKPIILYKGTWHNVAALTRGCELKICEGIEVAEDYHKLPEPIEPNR